MYYCTTISLFILLCWQMATAREPVRVDAAASAKVPYSIPRIDEEIRVDGRLDEKVWEQALTIEVPYETWPGENTPAPVRTEALLVYSRTHLYVGFKAFDPKPEQIRANFADRDNLYEDDFCVLFLDTFNDERRAFAVRSNPLGVQADNIIIGNPGAAGTTGDWDAIYASEGRITDWGYVVEMAVPFNQLRFQRSDGEQVWGLNLRRLYPRSVLCHIDAVPMDRNNDSQVAQYLKVRGFEGAAPGRNIELVPTLTAVHSDARPELPAGRFENGTRDAEAGLSARWGLTNNLTLNGALNPDFSQVEADALQLDINEPFALGYAEKRPFFTEGADYFATPARLLYTRTLRDPDWGVKLTGKENSHTIGLYLVRDRLTNLIFPGSQSSQSASLPRENSAAVLRYKRDIGTRYTMGVMATGREGRDYHNRVAGVDGNLRVTNKDRIQLQLLGSSTRYPAAISSEYGQARDAFNGHFLELVYTHESRNLSWDLTCEDAGNGFRADLGFIPMVGYRTIAGSAFYAWLARPGRWWTQFGPYSRFNYTQESAGGLLTQNFSFGLNYQGKRQSHSHLQANLQKKNFAGREFNLVSYSHCMGLYPLPNVWFHHSLQWGDRIDYANARQGHRLRFDPEAGINLGRHLRVDLSHTFERMAAGPARLYSAHISQARCMYHFNVRAFMRATLQYVHYGYNTANYGMAQPQKFEHFFTQLLFSYKINPFTVFFLGYSDNYLAGEEFGLTQTDRTLFAKLSYAWAI